MPKWSTITTSLLAEVQWRFAEKWSAFLGGRVDWHTHVKKEMISPRVAIIHELTKKDTLKVIVSNSVRASTAEDMKKAYDEGNKSDYEDMLNYELQWQRQQTGNLWIGASLFYNERHVVAWDQGESLIGPLGDMSIYGAEAEVLYKTDRMSMTLSHGYSQLHRFKLDDPSTDQFTPQNPMDMAMILRPGMTTSPNSAPGTILQKKSTSTGRWSSIGAALGAKTTWRPLESVSPGTIPRGLPLYGLVIQLTS
jgi:outer membrane receptor protein involved in Fe transport